MSFTGAIVAGHRKRRERELVGHLRAQAALSPATAAALELRRGLRQAALRGLVRHGAVMQVGADLYWLDEAAYAAMRQKRRRTMVWMMTVALVVAVVGVIVIVMAINART